MLNGSKNKPLLIDCVFNYQHICMTFTTLNSKIDKLNDEVNDGKKGTQYNWLPILNQVNRASNKFYNDRDLKKRFQKQVVLSEEYIVQQYEKWRDRYKLGQLQLYKVALLRSLPGCGRQYYHCDTHSVNTLKDEQFDDYHLGAVCAPWQKAKLHIK